MSDSDASSDDKSSASSNDDDSDKDDSDKDSDDSDDSDKDSDASSGSKDSDDSDDSDDEGEGSESEEDSDEDTSDDDQAKDAIDYKPSKFHELMSALKSINLDLDMTTHAVDHIEMKFSNKKWSTKVGLREEEKRQLLDDIDKELNGGKR